MILDILTIITCILAALLQLAVIRDLGIPEDRSVESGRWMIASGYASLGVTIAFQLISHGAVTALSDGSEVAVCLMASGHIALAWHRLAAHPIRQGVKQ